MPRVPPTFKNYLMIRLYGIEGYNYLPKMREKIGVFEVKIGQV